MGYKGRMTGQGFRGLASTILHERGYMHEYIELQLAHAPRNAVSAAYNHAPPGSASYDNAGLGQLLGTDSTDREDYSVP